MHNYFSSLMSGMGINTTLSDIKPANVDLPGHDTRTVSELEEIEETTYIESLEHKKSPDPAKSNPGRDLPTGSSQQKEIFQNQSGKQSVQSETPNSEMGKQKEDLNKQVEVVHNSSDTGFKSSSFETVQERKSDEFNPDNQSEKNQITDFPTKANQSQSRDLGERQNISTNKKPSIFDLAKWMDEDKDQYSSKEAYINSGRNETGKTSCLSVHDLTTEKSPYTIDFQLTIGSINIQVKEAPAREPNVRQEVRNSQKGSSDKPSFSLSRHFIKF